MRSVPNKELQQQQPLYTSAPMTATTPASRMGTPAVTAAPDELLDFAAPVVDAFDEPPVVVVAVLAEAFESDDGAAVGAATDVVFAVALNALQNETCCAETPE